MLIPNHPHDERLSALASGDPEASADSALTAHVSSCARCTDAVAELGALRASLAELPDLRPHRPLRLLPEVTDAASSRVDRVGGWARRLFAPALTAGAAIAMIGLVGTAAPALDGLAGGQAGGTDSQEAAMPAEEEVRDLSREFDQPAAEGGSSTATDQLGGGETGDTYSGVGGEAEPLATDDGAGRLSLDDADSTEQQPLPAERSPWPMVLFTGVAVMIAAALLRWILAPRAG